jgi:hypothetical protein
MNRQNIWLLKDSWSVKLPMQNFWIVYLSKNGIKLLMYGQVAAVGIKTFIKKRKKILYKNTGNRNSR